MKNRFLFNLLLMCVSFISIGTYGQEILRDSIYSDLPIGLSQMDSLSLFKTNQMLKEENALFENLFEKTIVESDSLSNDIAGRFSATEAANYSSGGPTNIIDKMLLKPSVGSFSNEINLNDNLHKGKVGVNIPLFDFEYFGFKIPVFLNNNYPQKIKRNVYGEPIFYASTRVGGDWTLSIDQFKVSRQINGVADDNSTKGYFSSYSQSKVNNPTSLSDGDIYNGLKDGWDPAVDVYHFSTPTVSGSFLLNLIDGTFSNLTDGNFTVKYTTNQAALNSFTITDDQGNQYLFGGDNTTKEVTQSKTDIYSMGYDNMPGQGRLKFIIKTNNDGTLASYHEFNGRGNAYGNSPNWMSPLPPVNHYVMKQLIEQNNGVNGYENRLAYLGGNFYGIWDTTTYCFYNSNSTTCNELQSISDDSDLRKSPVVTSWYLKEIKLLNGKRIVFEYTNKYQAYQTKDVNKVVVKSVAGYNYDGTNIPYVYRYQCMPEVFDFSQFPINETISTTTHFVKRPKLKKVYDENFVNEIVLTDGSAKQGYVRPPSLYGNAPQDVLNEADNDCFLYSTIQLKRGGSTAITANLTYQRSYAYNSAGTVSYPNSDKVGLSKVAINTLKKYEMTIDANFQLKSMKFPTGTIKEFSKRLFTSAPVFKFNIVSGDVREYDYAVDKITTTSENNITEEKYVLESASFLKGERQGLKAYRPGFSPCTTLALVNSSSDLFNSYATIGGLMFKSAKKYVNNELRFFSEVRSDLPYTFSSNLLYNTNGSLEADGAPRPMTIRDQQIAAPKKIIEYKKDLNNQTVKLKTTDVVNNFSSQSNILPSLYLVNLEAGPWSTTPGAIRRGYSKYFYPRFIETYTVNKVDTLFLDNNAHLRSEESYNYSRYRDIGGRNVRGVSSMTKLDSDGNLWKDVYSTYGSSMISPGNLYDRMTKNNISPSLVSAKYKNLKLIDVEAQQYKLLPINSSIPVVESDKKVETLEDGISGGDWFYPLPLLSDPRMKEKIIYDRYDNNGRLIEYHTPDGIYTSIIWGYKGQYPIAKIENANYSEVEQYVANLQYLSDRDLDGSMCSSYPTDPLCNEQILRVALNNFRMAPGLVNKSKISTYTYNYGTGISSSTDDRGVVTYFEYDSLNRLKMIRDSNRNIIKTYDYHYKN